MRTRAFIVIAVAALALAGCGDHNLVLKVDVLSYLDSSLRTVDFGPVPAESPAHVSGEQALVDDAALQLLDGLDSAAEVRSVSIGLSAFTHDSTGSGSDTLRIYLSDENTHPLAWPPSVMAMIEPASIARSRSKSSKASPSRLLLRLSTPHTRLLWVSGTQMNESEL